MNTQTINLDEINSDIRLFSGIEDRNILLLEKEYDVTIGIRDNTLRITGEEPFVSQATSAIHLMFEIIHKYKRIDTQEIKYIITLVNENRHERFIELVDDIITRTHLGKPVRAKTLGQRRFVEEVGKNDLTFAIGPAGTGKTYLAVCYAVELLKRGDVSKIILTRPAVEAGENLGFLPGDLKEKVDPYLRPLYDSLYDMLSAERTLKYIEKNTIEIAPLAYMRGRTLNDAIIILDEAQNTTKAQMLMFLSRLGRSSKMIVTGDLTQIDLVGRQQSGLKVAADYLKDIPEISFVWLTHLDIVRHPLVVKILKEFEKGETHGKNSDH